MNNKPTCPDCGSAPTNHFMSRLDSWITIVILRALRPLNILNEKISFLIAPFFRKITPRIINALVKANWARVLTEPDAKTVFRARCLWEEAQKRGIIMREFRLFNFANDSFFASHNNEYVFFQGLPRPKENRPSSLSWMDNKAEMKKRFDKIGIPVSKGGVFYRLGEAIQLFLHLSKPVIIKPNLGSRSRHTTVHIDNEQTLKTAFLKAKEICPWVMLEEEFIGSVYRATVIGGKLVGVLRRDPACVEGDGIKNVRELIEEENKKPLRQGPLFHHIIIDVAAEKELARQNLNWESVPRAGQLVALGTKTSRGVGGGLTDTTAETHPDNVELFKKIAAVLENCIVGIDFIIADIKKSWRNQEKSGVIECNSLPFIDLHHYPLKGQPQNVAKALWDIIFPRSVDNDRLNIHQ